MNLQEALAAALGKRPIPSNQEEQGGKTSKPLTLAERLANAIADARRNVSHK
jgi:hypothetical protein